MKHSVTVTLTLEEVKTVLQNAVKKEYEYSRSVQTYLYGDPTFTFRDDGSVMLNYTEEEEKPKAETTPTEGK